MLIVNTEVYPPETNREKKSLITYFMTYYFYQTYKHK